MSVQLIERALRIARQTEIPILINPERRVRILMEGTQPHKGRPFAFCPFGLGVVRSRLQGL